MRIIGKISRIVGLLYIQIVVFGANILFVLSSVIVFFTGNENPVKLLSLVTLNALVGGYLIYVSWNIWDRNKQSYGATAVTLAILFSFSASIQLLFTGEGVTGDIIMGNMLFYLLPLPFLYLSYRFEKPETKEKKTPVPVGRRLWNILYWIFVIDVVSFFLMALFDSSYFTVSKLRAVSESFLIVLALHQLLRQRRIFGSRIWKGIFWYLAAAWTLDVVYLITNTDFGIANILFTSFPSSDRLPLFILAALTSIPALFAVHMLAYPAKKKKS